MKATDLLTNNPEILEKLSDKELEEVLRPFFTTTRPDETKRQQKKRETSAAPTKTPAGKKRYSPEQLQAMLDKL